MLLSNNVEKVNSIVDYYANTKMYNCYDFGSILFLIALYNGIKFCKVRKALSYLSSSSIFILISYSLVLFVFLIIKIVFLKYRA